MQENTLEIIPLAIMIEASITYVNQFFVCGNFCWKMILSLLFGIVLSISYNINIPKYFKLNSNIPYLGNILSGIMLSRGSNYVYDLMTTIKNFK